MSDLDTVLAHFGVKGMKWGVKGGASKAGKASKPSHPDSPDHTHAQNIKTKGKQGGTRALSNKEIQDYMARVGLEKQFRSTTPRGKTTAFVSQILGGVGRQQITSVANQQASRGVAEALKRAGR